MDGKYTQRINSYLKTKKITWGSLAQKLDVDPKTLGNWKRKDNYPLQSLEIIADILEISVSELTDVDGNYGTMRKLLSKVDMLRKTLSEEMEDVTERLL